MSYLAKRLDYFQESVIREMTRKAIENDSINLSQGMPDFSPPEILLKGLSLAIEKEEHQYSVTYGRYDLRQKISQKLETYNKLHYTPDDEITITCGASEAIASSLFSILNPKDEILILEPWYENYVPITYLAQGFPKFVQLSNEEFMLDEERLKACINKKTKAIVINTPHNPTGKIFNKSELNIIADLSNDNDLLVITDEIYEYIIYDNRKHISPASLDKLYNNTITISGFSKTFSVTGWRVGYVAAPKELMLGIRKVHDYLTVCAPSLLQFAVLKSFELQEKYYKDLISRYEKNRNYLYEKMNEFGFNPILPQGAYYLFVDISNFGLTDIDFANFLVKNKGVAVVPGSSFYQKTDLAGGKKYVRFSFSQKFETIKEACRRIEKFINLEESI